MAFFAQILKDFIHFGNSLWPLNFLLLFVWWFAGLRMGFYGWVVYGRLWKLDCDRMQEMFRSIRLLPRVQGNLSHVLSHNPEAASRLPQLNDMLESGLYWQVRGRYTPVGGWASIYSQSDPRICLGLERWVLWVGQIWPKFVEDSVLHELVHAAQEVRENSLTKEFHGGGLFSSILRFKSTITSEREAYWHALRTGMFFVSMFVLMMIPVVTLIAALASLWFWATLAGMTVCLVAVALLWG